MHTPDAMLGLHAMGTEPIVTIYLQSPLRRYSGGASQLGIAARTVKAALEDLERSQSALYRNICDETGALRRHLNVFVNSDNIRDLDGVDTILVAGDVLTFLPAVSGG
jgi:molybdopterin synthase sulfur carrier subunit